MDSATVVFIAFILGAIGLVWFLVQRYLRTAARLDAQAEGASELGAFIAAYRSGQIDPRAVQSAADGGPATAALAAAPAARAARPAAPKPASARPLLRPEVKLAYLSLRSGLRDHHVFANLPLSDVSVDLAGRIDLLVCRPDFSILAAIDVSAGPATPVPGRTEALRAAGVRYLRLDAKAMPKPDALRALLYPA